MSGRFWQARVEKRAQKSIAAEGKNGETKLSKTGKTKRGEGAPFADLAWSSVTVVLQG